LGLGDFRHIFMPRNAIPFQRVGPPLGATVALGATFTAASDLSNQINIPSKCEGWIVQLGVLLGTYGNGQTWSITADGAPIRDYTSVPFPVGALETPVARAIKINAGQVISINFFNPGGAPGPLSFGYSMYGWYYPA